MIALPEIAKDSRAQRNDEELARLGAPLASPVFTGNPQAPTPAVDDNDTSIATTAFVIGQAATAAPLIDGVAAVGASKRYAREDHVHPIDTSRAPTASPSLTGVVSIDSAAELRLLLTSARTSDPSYIGAGLFPTQNTGAAYPYLEGGNLVIGSRWSGAARDILFYTGNPPTLRVAVSRSADGLVFGPVGSQDATLSRVAAAILRASGLEVTGDVGFFGTAHQAKKTVTGSRGGNAALASLLTQLAGYGLLTDSSTA